MTSGLLKLVAIILTSFLSKGNAGSLQKPYRLSLLSLNAFSGLEPRDNQLCKTTQQMVVDIANKRNDFLPDYFIELDFKDEGPAGNLATMQVVEYTRRIAYNDLTYQSPIVMGPLLTGGCKSWARISHHMNMVTMAASCTAPSQTARRDVYPNMYRLRAPAELMIYARFHVFRQVTKWRRMAILMNMNGNPYNYETAMIANKVAVETGFEVAAFEASPDFNDELMLSLKEADIRIFNMESAESLAGLRFLCQAYKFGITGPRYFFAFQLITYVDPYKLAEEIYPGCTRKIIMEQFQRSIFIGAPFDAIDPVPGSTVLGHTMDDFEKLFDAATKKSRTADYDFRHMCYDRILQTLVMLNDSEHLLAKQNKSLRDYQNEPEFVMKIVNQSAANVNFRNLRHGQFRYSSRLEVDFEPQFVALWSPAIKGLLVSHRVRCSQNATNCTNANSYYMEKIRDLNVHLPNDGPNELVFLAEMTTGDFAGVAVTSLAIATGQAFVGKLAVAASTDSVAVASLIIAGCLFLDGGAVTIAVSNSLITLPACYLQVIFTSIGISLLTATLGIRVFFAYKECYVASLITKGYFNKNKKNYAGTSFLMVFTLAFVSVNEIIVFVAVITDPMQPFRKAMVGTPSYDEVTDSVTRTWQMMSCETNAATIWQSILIVLNFIPLLVGLLFVIQLNTKEGAKYCREMKLATVIASTLYLGAITLIYIQNDSPIAQHITASWSMLFGSFTISTTVFYSNIKAKMFSSPPTPPSPNSRKDIKIALKADTK